jgi:hypothetical protein
MIIDRIKLKKILGLIASFIIIGYGIWMVLREIPYVGYHGTSYPPMITNYFFSSVVILAGLVLLLKVLKKSIHSPKGIE